ncbi:hypothetical protein O5268_12660 [Escherichia coli]|nr:hypothetical protein [Escherichia coli]
MTELGVFFPTGTTHSILEVINGYLKDSLTVDELSFILEHREKFVFSLGVGIGEIQPHLSHVLLMWITGTVMM